MHNIDRTDGEYESESEFEFEVEPFEFEFAGEVEVPGDVGVESPFDEIEEMDLAANLLEITDESELDQFLGRLIRRVGRKIGKVVKSPVGRALGGVLKVAARKALPIVGGALGGAIGGPAGAMIGKTLATTAGRAFGLELEGLSPEDQEFEIARRFVRFAGAAAKKAALTPPTVDPQTAAKTAVASAARRYAPGLLSGAAPVITSISGGRSGRWIRRGRKIILLGV